ncbi:hypothetical protein PM082_003250 [Marasmius tenuissimus]|nr:hypothetical protein PM082_003250 [Marasmius tenuissimus]
MLNMDFMNTDVAKSVAKRWLTGLRRQGSPCLVPWDIQWLILPVAIDVALKLSFILTAENASLTKLGQGWLNPYGLRNLPCRRSIKKQFIEIIRNHYGSSEELLEVQGFHRHKLLVK